MPINDTESPESRISAKISKLEEKKEQGELTTAELNELEKLYDQLADISANLPA